MGSKERMEQFPELVGKHINLRGTGHNNSVIDLVLSSVGKFLSFNNMANRMPISGV